MASDLATLQSRESELKNLLSPKANPTAQEKKVLREQLNTVYMQIENLIAFDKLKVGHYVAKKGGTGLGKITEKTPGHQPTVFVSWDESVPVPEQPRLLEFDEMSNSGTIKAGDIVRVASRENGKVIGYRLEKIQSLQARGWIGVSNNEVVSPTHWELVQTEDFDRWDFDWIVGFAQADTEAKNWINTRAAIARSSLGTAICALNWVKQYMTGGDKGRIEALEKHIRKLDNPTNSLPPWEYLRELKIRIQPPIAAKKVDAVAVDKLLRIIVAAATTEELEIAECLIADAEKFALSKGLVLALADGWSITPMCTSVESALALCPSPGDRVTGIQDRGESCLGFVQGYTTEEIGSRGIQVQAQVLWDDGATTIENGFGLETLPPLLEYLANIQNAQVENVPASPLETNEVEQSEETSVDKPRTLLPLGVQEVLVSQLRSHPINSSIYGEVEDDTTLDEMIQSSNWIKTLLVTPEGEVVGGNRRLRIAVKQQREKVLAEVREFANDEAVLEALLLDNAVREKTVEQKVKEARCWLPIETEKAKLRKGRSDQENNPCGDKGQVRDIVAARVGLGSGKNLQKAEKVLSAIEELKAVDTVAHDGLRHLLNNKSIHAAYQLVCANEETIKWRPNIGDHVTVSLKAEHHAGVSGTITSDGRTALVVKFDQISEGMEQDIIYLNMLLPVDVTTHTAKKKAEAVQKNPERASGLKEQPGGGLLPEKDRNEGDPRTLLNDGKEGFVAYCPIASSPDTTQNEDEGILTTHPSNVVTMPLRSYSDPMSVAKEIALGIRHLSPKELAWVLNWAADDKTNPLSDEHLDAIVSAVINIKNKRHSESLEIAN
jgi:hypothetical protein